jgi:hypothetical protein
MKPPQNSRADILLDVVQKGAHPRGEKIQLHPTNLTYSTRVMGWVVDYWAILPESIYDTSQYANN